MKDKNVGVAGAKADIVKSILVYVPSRYFSQFLGFFTTLIMKRFLGPLFTGIWDLLKLVMQYVDYSELGATQAIYYKIPFLNGQGKTKEAKNVQNVIFAFILGSSLVAGIGMALYALIFSGSLDPHIYAGLFACSVIIVFERVYAFYVMLARAYKDYAALSKAILFDAVLSLLLAVFVISRFRLYGLFIGIIVTTILNIWYIRRNVRYDIGFRFDLRSLVSYIKFGFPMYLTSILTMLLNSIDRVMIAGLLGLQQLGFYSIAMMSKSYSAGLTTNFSHVTSPYFVEDAGRHGESEKIYAYVIKGTFAFSCFMSFVLGIIYIYSTPVIETVLPSFMPGLVALKIFLITNFFSSLMSFPTNYIVVRERQNTLVLFASIALGVNVVLNYFFIKRGLGINGVAAATAIASFIYLIIVFVYAIRNFSRSIGIWHNMAKILAPAAYVLLIILLLDKFVTHSNHWVEAVIRSAVLSILSILIAVILEKETGLVKIFVNIIKERLKKNGE